MKKTPKSKAKKNKLKSVPTQPVFRYFLSFSILIVFFYFAINLWVFESAFYDWLISVNTNISSALLNLLAQPTSTEGEIIHSSRFSISIARDCDAVMPIALFMAAILAYPSLLVKKGIGVLVGIPLLFFLNIIRIVSLFLVGVYLESLFDVMHVDVWQFIFILVTLLVFMQWVRWANAGKPTNYV